jgi:hypothetical protein
MITWDDISSHLTYCKLTGTEPDEKFASMYRTLTEMFNNILYDEAVSYKSYKTYYISSFKNILFLDKYNCHHHLYGEFKQNCKKIIIDYLKFRYDISLFLVTYINLDTI